MSFIKDVIKKIDASVDKAVEDIGGFLENPGGTIAGEFENYGEQLRHWRDSVRNLNPAGVSEELWGEGGRFAYTAAAEIMSKRSPTGEAVSNNYKDVLRPHFVCVDHVKIHWGTDPLDKWAADNFSISLTNTDTEAQTYGYDIYVKKHMGEMSKKEELSLLAHELTHSEQYERFGKSLSNFGYHYFKEFKKAGQNYENNVLEVEAYRRASEFDQLPDVFAVGSILWCNADQRASWWKINDSGGQVNFKEHGPFTGWQPVNCAKDKILWRNADGKISLWKIDDTGNRINFKEHGPFAGWSVVNSTNDRILWHHTDGRISLWKVDDVGNRVNYKEHGPFPGWTPVNCVWDRILWHHTDGRISLWKVDDAGNRVSYKEHGPFPGWDPVRCSSERILWQHTDGRISLWRIDDTGNQISYKEHGPFPGWKPVNCTRDRILFRHTDSRCSLWKIDDAGNRVSFKEHGPFANWTPIDYSDR